MLFFLAFFATPQTPAHNSRVFSWRVCEAFGVQSLQAASKRTPHTALLPVPRPARSPIHVCCVGAAAPPRQSSTCLFRTFPVFRPAPEVSKFSHTRTVPPVQPAAGSHAARVTEKGSAARGGKKGALALAPSSAGHPCANHWPVRHTSPCHPHLGAACSGVTCTPWLRQQRSYR